MTLKIPEIPNSVVWIDIRVIHSQIERTTATFLAADGKPSETQKLFAETIGKIESKKAGFAHAIPRIKIGEICSC